MANLVSLSRVGLLFVAVAFVYLSVPHGNSLGAPVWALVAAILTLIVFLGDALDGVIARARGEQSTVGAVIDIAGDRIVENVYWVVLAQVGLLSIWYPLIMLVRSFLVDGARSLALAEGKTAFGEKTMMKSDFGTWLAASRLHRALYGGAKVVTFIWMLLYLALKEQIQIDHIWQRNMSGWADVMQTIGLVLAFFTLLYSLLRGAVVLWDSRDMFGIKWR